MKVESALRDYASRSTAALIGLLACLGLVVMPQWQLAEEMDGDDSMNVDLPVINGDVNMVTASVGMQETGTGQMTMTIPSDASVVVAYLYWGGHDGDTPPDNTGDEDLVLSVDSGPGVVITGDLVGITPELSLCYRFTYRADITSYVLAGAHDYDLSGFDKAILGEGKYGLPYGAGILAIYSQEGLEQSQIQIADGADYFYQTKSFPTSELLRFDFVDSPMDRTVDIVNFVGGVGDDQASGYWYLTGEETMPPDTIVDAPGAVDYNNSSSPDPGVDTDLFFSADGLEWDGTSGSLVIPAGSSWLAVQIESQTDSPNGKRPASGTWHMCALRLPLMELGSIGDFVWDDVDGDGVQDAGEQGLDGIRVDISNQGGTWSTYSITGDNPATPEVEHGWYDFTDLAAGGYTVGVDESTLPPNFAGYPPLLTTGNEPLAVTLVEGQDFDDADFGYVENPVPVELVSFSAIWNGSVVHLFWNTASETENMGFDIFRSEVEEGPYVRLNEVIIPGAGNSDVSHNYGYIDRQVDTDRSYYYKLSDTDYHGSIAFYGPISVAVSPIPVAYELHQNYPNPFNPETNIRFVLKENGKVNIGIYNMAGQLVRTLIDEAMQQGIHSVVWDGKGDEGVPLSSGTYFCIMRINGFEISRKLVFAK